MFIKWLIECRVSLYHHHIHIHYPIFCEWKCKRRNYYKSDKIHEWMSHTTRSFCSLLTITTEWARTTSRINELNNARYCHTLFFFHVHSGVPFTLTTIFFFLLFSHSVPLIGSFGRALIVWQKKKKQRSTTSNARAWNHTLIYGNTNNLAILNRRKMTVMPMNGLLHINIYGMKCFVFVCCCCCLCRRRRRMPFLHFEHFHTNFL